MLLLQLLASFVEVVEEEQTGLEEEKRGWKRIDASIPRKKRKIHCQERCDQVLSRLQACNED